MTPKEVKLHRSVSAGLTDLHQYQMIINYLWACHWSSDNWQYLKLTSNHHGKVGQCWADFYLCPLCQNFRASWFTLGWAKICWHRLQITLVLLMKECIFFQSGLDGQLHYKQFTNTVSLNSVKFNSEKIHYHYHARTAKTQNGSCILSDVPDI